MGFGERPERGPESVCWVGQRWDGGMAQRSCGWAVTVNVIHRRATT